MELNVLTAISPIDGRYRSKTDKLAGYFSEYALIRYRVRVEIEYFITLCELPLPQLEGFDRSLFEALRDIYRNFTEQDAACVKDIEKVTNHDVKAVEYFIKEKIDALGGFPAEAKEFIHFGLTSQDINNTSVPLSIKEALEDVYFPMVEELIEQLNDYAEQWKNVPMLAKTHGQPASPTRLGKEVMVYVYRLLEQLRSLKDTPITAKFGGATGNYNAHHVAYPGRHRYRTTTGWELSSMPGAASIPSLSTWTATSGCISRWNISSRKSRRARWAQVLCRTR